MPKGNPFRGTRRRPIVRIERTLVSRDNGEEYPVFMRKLDTLEALAAAERAQEFGRRYVWGTELLPPVGDRAVLPSMTACTMVATFLAAQIGPESDRYTDQEVFAMLSDDVVGHEPVKNADGSGSWARLPSLYEQIDELLSDVSPSEEVPKDDPLAVLSGRSSSSDSSPVSDTPE